jgi:TetR/AcrR family transcriptional repressor of nem operon
LPEPARARYTEGVERIAAGIGKLLKKLGKKNTEALAFSALAEMAGTLTFARAIMDPERSDRLLRASSELVKERLGVSLTG